MACEPVREEEVMGRETLLSRLNRRFGVTASRNGIYIGQPRLLDIETHGGTLSFRTYNHVLTVWVHGRPRFYFGRSKW